MIVDGVEWLTAAEACAQLGPDVRPERIRDWRRRGLLPSSTVVREGRTLVGYHRRDELVSAERHTRRRGRPRTTVDKIGTPPLT